MTSQDLSAVRPVAEPHCFKTVPAAFESDLLVWPWSAGQGSGSGTGVCSDQEPPAVLCLPHAGNVHQPRQLESHLGIYTHYPPR